MSNRKANFATALRIVDLILFLSRRRTACPVKTAAAELEVHPKTIVRYVAALQARLVDDDGNPLLTLERRGKTPYLVARGPLLGADASIFDYASLFLAMRLLDFADGQLHGGLQRIAEGLAPQLQHREAVARFTKKFFVYHTGWHQRPDSELMADIISGLVNERRISIRYHSWKSAKVVEPLALAVYKEGLYLIVRLPGKSNAFTLTAPLIREVEYLPKEKFRYPAAWSPETYRGDRFGMMPGKPSKVEFCAAPFLAAYFAARNWHASQRVTTESDGRLRVTLKVTHSPELVAWLCAFGPDVEVLAPRALRAEVSERLRKGAAVYAAASSPTRARG